MTFHGCSGPIEIPSQLRFETQQECTLAIAQHKDLLEDDPNATLKCEQAD